MTRVWVDPDRCVGHGRCYTLAPDVFDADEIGHSVVRVEHVLGELEKQAIIGVQNCPEQAITLSPDDASATGPGDATPSQ